MKVLCINTDLQILDNSPSIRVRVGHTYFVDEIVHWYERDWYLINGMGDWGYNPICFIPVSDIDELDFYIKSELCVR